LTAAPLSTTPVGEAVGSSSVIAVVAALLPVAAPSEVDATLSLGVIDADADALLVPAPSNDADASSVSLIALLVPTVEPVNAPPGTRLPPVIVRLPVPNAAPESRTNVPPLIVVPPV
jgi:hypothetical protein